MLKLFKAEVKKELLDHMLPFWTKLIDREYGGFFGSVDYDLNVDPHAPKGGIALSRYLWSFSSVYRVTKDATYLEYARHAYDFLVNRMLDPIHQGIYWTVDYKGDPLDTRKHVYAQVFAIYALSEYYRVTNYKPALIQAIDLYSLVESKGYSAYRGAYLEEFTKEWISAPNEMLSENGVMAEITTNTHLHVLEAYTNLYRVWPVNDLKNRIENLLHIFYEKIYDSKTGHLNVFFNENWESIISLKSFGHDIEASWLLDEALKVVKLEDSRYKEMVLSIAYTTQKSAIQMDGSIMNEEENGKTDDTRVWWVQAEAMVGFLNAYEHTKEEIFLKSLLDVWEYVKNNLIDPRIGGEWFWSVNHEGIPSTLDVSNSWKVLYHNSRFCLEVMERVNDK